MTANSVSVVIDKDSIAVLTLGRAKAMNSFDRAQVEAFNDVLDGLKLETGLRALVVRGAGRVFCAGADVRYLRDMGAGPWEQNLEDSEYYAGMSKRMRLLPVPVISCVQGGAYGGGNRTVSNTHHRAQETPEHLICRLLHEKKKGTGGGGGG